MLAIPEPLETRRRVLRRAVSIECAVRSGHWDGPARHLATDLSPLGLWLRSDLALEAGEQLVVTFRPPRWPERALPVSALGQVVRVAMPRRRADHGPAGMGLEFVDLENSASSLMGKLLRGLPPPIPLARALPPPPARDATQPPLGLFALDAPFGEPLRAHEPQLVLDDGSLFELRAEGQLLTCGRPRLWTVPRALPVAKVRRPVPKRRSKRRRRTFKLKLAG